jgi:hypothetical protein
MLGIIPTQGMPVKRSFEIGRSKSLFHVRMEIGHAQSLSIAPVYLALRCIVFVWSERLVEAFS